MLLNSSGKILARPRLLLNGNICPFDVVESASAEILTTSEPRVTATKAYDKLTLQKDKELVFEFEVGPKIISASLTFKIKLKDLDKK